MSVNVDMRVAGPGDESRVEEAWQLKERIRREEGVLKQRRGFFTQAYRRAMAHLLLTDDELVAFSATRNDGYILFLAVSPDHRGEGLGRRLAESVAEEHDVVTCHARSTNEDALAFYEELGFDVARRVDNYYEDNGDAYYLKRGEDAGITQRLSDIIRR